MDQLTAAGAYVFAGGHTIGVEQHFKVLAHLEDNPPYGGKTFRLNRPWIPVYAGHERWAAAPLDPLDYLYCNPPCAIVSVAGKSVKHGADSWKTDERTNCIHRCFAEFRRRRPTFFTLESVCQLYTRARELVDELEAEALSMGYAVTHLFINAKWHGVAQERKRYFFMAHKMEFNPVALNYAPPATVGERLELVEDPGFVHPSTDRWTKLFRKLEPGEGLRHRWELENPESTWTRNAQGGVVGRPRQMEHRIWLDRPMGAFIGDFFVHPTLPRRLGLNEAKVLCGFPLDWEFANEAQGFSELARGVMPPVAEWLARSVAQSIRHGRLVAEGASRVLDLREAPT